MVGKLANRGWLAAAGAMAVAACAESPAPPAAPFAGVTPASEPVVRVATLNAGTTEFMALLEPSPRRDLCSDWYENNLCTLDSEAALAGRIAATRPDLIFLQEMWYHEACADPERPPEADTEPYACAAPGDQLERVLPPDYAYGCDREHPDNCIAFRPEVFAPAGRSVAAACEGRDCSAAMAAVTSDCAGPGRATVLTGTTVLGPTALVDLHINAGPDPDSQACRANQLASLQPRLAALPPTTVLIMAGDFNFDLLGTEPNPDVAAIRALTAAVDLEILPPDPTTRTNRLLGTDLDFVLARGWPAAGTAAATCTAEFLDSGQPVPMYDHAYVGCR